MGQRLNIEIRRKKDNKILANSYYHWTAYTYSSLRLAEEIGENIYDIIRNDKTSDEIKAIQLLQTTGAGLLEDEYNLLKEEDKKYCSLATDRNLGLISFTEKGIENTRNWEEGRLTINVDFDDKEYDFVGDKNRVDFLPYISPEDYLKSYSKVDFVLDSFPVSGMTTTAEALCMGVPILTLLGERMPSRLSGSCLNAVGLHEWICNDEQEFVEKAKYFAAPQQRDYLQNLHKTLRERTMKSPLCDTQKLAENFEKAMWHFWQNFVNQL